MIMLDKTDLLERVDPKTAQRTREDQAEYEQLDKALDEGLKESFPASDPVAVVQQTPERSTGKR